MLSIISNRRRGVRWWVKALWALALIVVAVLVVLLIDRRTQPVKYTPSEDTATQNSTSPTTDSAQTNNGQSSSATSGDNTQPPVTDENNSSTNNTATSDSNATSVSYDGTDVHLGSVTVKVPKQWYFSYSQESVGQLLNFGTQNFGPDNPYQASMSDDASGYLGPVESIPSEAVGPLMATDTITLANGQAVEKKTYKGTTPDGVDLTQVVATFKSSDKEYGILFYTQTKNEEQLQRLDDMLHLISY